VLTVHVPARPVVAAVEVDVGLGLALSARLDGEERRPEKK
jgi:hypothetical protein